MKYRLNIPNILLLFAGIFLISSCTQKETPLIYTSVSGKTMGTFYNIKMATSHDIDIIKSSLDSILNEFENELSTYRPNSTISSFNQSEKGICVDSTSAFYRSFNHANNLFRNTEGYFDPTIAPLVNYWGFGSDRQDKKTLSSSDTLSAILKLVGLNKLTSYIENEKVCINKEYPEQKLDLNASAKGLGVDIVAEYIMHLGIENFMVEIGGEVRVKGRNNNGDYWVLGINKPSPNANIEDIILPVKLVNQSMATSGNYRQFYKEGSLTFAHIINAKTGQSIPTDLLSASVIADHCETADAYATAFMAMGKEKAIQLSKKIKNIETCFIYHNIEGDSLAFNFSEGFQERHGIEITSNK